MPKINDKQREVIARRMGYTGPMHKFTEFLVSSNSPVRKFATGGLVTAPYEVATPTTTVPEVEVSPVWQSQTQFINQGSGQLTGPDPTITQSIAQTSVAENPNTVVAPTVDPFLTQPGVDGLVNQFQYAQGTVNPESTVQGQMANLMDDFEGGATPVWAAGALRNANEQMNARGLGASSMAGSATTQAAMEAAIPIAQQDAATNFAMQQQNLSNEQQVLVQRNQARTDAFFTDAATINATNQFNATNQMQVDTFNTNLRSQVQQFNAAQRNAMAQYNSGQANSMSMFRAEMRDGRQRFNAGNRLIIDQANATWRQQLATIDNANVNEANRMNAQNLFAANTAEMNNIFQARRDAMNYAFNNAESEEDRALQLLLAQMSIEESERAGDQASRDGLWASVGAITAEFFDGWF